MLAVPNCPTFAISSRADVLQRNRSERRPVATQGAYDRYVRLKPSNSFDAQLITFAIASPLA
jgi:hypothetical protein